VKILYDGQFVEMSEEFSQKGHVLHSLEKENVPVGTNIYATCYSREQPDSIIFPKNMTGVTFYNCNLMNVYIPQGNTVVNCRTERFYCQNDLEDWEIDQADKPIKPINSKSLQFEGYAIEPKYIPIRRLEKREDMPKLADILAGNYDTTKIKFPAELLE